MSTLTPIQEIDLNLNYSQPMVTKRGKESRRRISRSLRLSIKAIPFTFTQGDLQVMATGNPEKILVTIMNKEVATHWFNVIPNTEVQVKSIL